MKIVVGVLVAFCFLSSAVSANFRAANATGPIPFIPAAAPTQNKYISPTGDFTIIWDLDLVAQVIHIQMSSPNPGWIGMGWSNQPTMRGSDYYVGSVDDNTGNVTLLDTWASADIIPTEDVKLGGTRDILAITGYSQVAGVTTIRFKRNFITNDKYDFPVANVQVYLMYAYAPTDIRVDGTYDIHTSSAYGITKANLLTGGVAAALYTPGNILGFLALAMSGVYVIGRLFKKLHQHIKRKLIKKQRALNNMIVETPSIDLTSEKDSAPPGYFVGSQQVVDTDKPKDKDPPEDYGKKSSVSGFEYEKEKGSEMRNKAWAVLEARVGYFQTPAMSIAAAILWVGMNVGCLFIYDVTLFSKGVGDLAAMNALLLLIPATRNSALVWATGIPFEQAIQYHRWLGYWTLIVSGIHMIYSFVIWYTGGADIGVQFSTKTNIYSLVAYFCSIVMMLTSLPFIRRKFFEVFYYTHFLFIAFFILLYFHNAKFAVYFWIALAIYLLDRLIRLIWGALPMKTVSMAVKGNEPDQLVQIRFEKNWLAKKTHAYKAGQYVFANFPQISVLEWHPFTISSGSHESTGEIHVKGLGKYTKKLIDFAKEREQMWIRVDGPYGNLNMNWRRYPIIVLIAGGIGVTPILAILRTLYRTGEVDPSSKKKAHCVEKVYVIWTVKNTDQYRWFAKDLQECYSNANKKSEGTPKLDLLIYVTKDKTAKQEQGFIRGRPDLPVAIEKIGEAFPEKASAVFVCGPQEMVDAAWDGTNIVKKKGQKCHFHHETFEL